MMVVAPLTGSHRIGVLSSIAVLCLVLLSGCAFNRGTWGDELRDEDIQMIKKGNTRADVVKTLGAPDRIVEANGHEIFQYYRYELRAMGFAPLIAMSRVYIVSDDLYVFLNKEAVVDDVVFGRRTNRQEYQFWPWGN
jgi:outer membrane protein assembly factor BamE (lipoprotein component of BamABCDE complex)